MPPPPLRPFIAAAYGYRAAAYPAGVHRGLPSRHLTLVVELLGPLRVAGMGGSLAAHGVVGGLHTAPAMIDASRAQEGLQYALTPLGAQALLGIPAAELSGHTVDLADLIGPTAGRLVDELQHAENWADRFRLLDVALLRRLTTYATIPGEVAEAWRMIFAFDGRLRVDSVAAHVGWGRRHLSERFRLATGITPKQAARIARFESARNILTAPARPPLAEIAARCGYADQSHLAREWRSLAGCSVGTWMAEELPFVQDDSAEERAESSA